MARGVDLGSNEDFPHGNPLHVTAKRNFFYVARILLDGEAPTDSLNDEGKVPLEVALEEKNDDVAALIVQRMSKARQVDFKKILAYIQLELQ